MTTTEDSVLYVISSFRVYLSVSLCFSLSISAISSISISSSPGCGKNVDCCGRRLSGAVKSGLQSLIKWRLISAKSIHPSIHPSIIYISVCLSFHPSHLWHHIYKHLWFLQLQTMVLDNSRTVMVCSTLSNICKTDCVLSLRAWSCNQPILPCFGVCMLCAEFSWG